MSKGIGPSPHSTLVPARMGWTQLSWESHPLLPPLHSAPRCRAGGGTLLAAAETPGYLGNLDSESGAGGDSQVEVSFDKSSLPKATAIPFSASLRFKPKPVFLYLKIKK